MAQILFPASALALGRERAGSIQPGRLLPLGIQERKTVSLVNQRLGFGWLSAFAAGQLGDAGKSLHQFPHLQSFGMCFEPPCWDYASPRTSGAAGAQGRRWEEPPGARWLWGLAGGISSVLLLLLNWGGDTALWVPNLST